MGFFISDSFSDALAKLPKEIRAKVSDTQNKYNNNRDHPGLNFEKIHAADDDIYSIRVNDDYRIICKCPDNSNTIFLYVDKHDPAYQWAKTNTCSGDVNGTMTVHRAIEPKMKLVDGKPKSRLNILTRDDFNALEIPEEYHDGIRNKVFVNSQLIGYKDYISDVSYFILEAILDGMAKDEAIGFYNEMQESDIPTPSAENPPLFDYSDSDIASIGVPVEQVDLVKHCRTKEELILIQDKLPEGAIQSLYELLDGESIEAIKKSKVSKNGIEDIDDILDSAGTKQSIVEMTGEEFDKLLEMPMAKWRVFLHPDQRHIIESNYNGPARVLGGAGTGKTVIVVHRAKELARKCTGDERVLVTTFSRTLADDIRERLRSICSKNEFRKIDVSTLDMLSRDYSDRFIKYDTKGKNSKLSPLKEAWKKAKEKANYTKFDENFYIDEWSEVIQEQKIETREEYLSATRYGRGGVRVDKADRDRIYTVMEYYCEYMSENRWIDIDWAENRCAERLNKKKEGKYRYIVVDECQDFRAPAFRLIRALAGEEHQNDLFLSGDSRQRIYNSRTSLSSCGIYVRNRSSQLKVNYRTTREIYDLSVKLQKDFNYDDLDNNPTEKDGSTSIRHGELPVIKLFDEKEDEFKAVYYDIKKRVDQGYIPSEMCIVAKTNKICDWIQLELNKRNIETLRLKPNQPDEKDKPGVRIATMHRTKGMEFDCIYAVSVNDNIFPYSYEYNNPRNDNITKQEILKKDANLLAVAITRARKAAWISSYGNPSILLEKITEQI